jgi:hypothetical protein
MLDILSHTAERKVQPVSRSVGQSVSRPVGVESVEAEAQFCGDIYP